MLTWPKILVCIVLAAVLVGEACADGETRRFDVPPTFRPVIRPNLPEAQGATRTGVDRFILAGAEARRLTLNPEADRATLTRRVCFDLTGLPPTIAELDAFLGDKATDAYEKMVERYLASPRYGERWGKFWLDAAGYADSNGYFHADSDRPLAWKYRDYVVESFHADKPYDQFVREQLAGDELVGYRPDGDVTPAMVEGLIAMHFLRNAPDGTGESDGNPDEVRTDRFTVLEGNIQNVFNCLLGLTVQCARCHDHKFELMTQKEYYGLQALLFPVYNPDRWSKPNDRVVIVGTRSDLAARARLNQQIDGQIKAVQAGLAAFAEPLRQQLLNERLNALDATQRAALQSALNTRKEKRTASQFDLLKRHAKRIEIADDMLAARFPEYRQHRDEVKHVVTQREKDRPNPADRIASFVETDAKPPTHHVLKRGQHDRPGEEAPAGVLKALTTANNRFQIEPPLVGRVSTGRRTALAKWVTSPENPLFARVMVNRIWQHHFGTGIVSTADNLGASGARASHPELLDYLAAEFMRSGWSVKAMHRLILTSAVYRQSSESREKRDAIDPDNRLLTRFPLRRLDAEAIRDAMLHVAGEIDIRAGGPYVPSKRTSEGTVEVAENQDGAHRRSIYLQQRRTQVVALLQLFDAPSMLTTCGNRSTSTVPLQSLALLNSEFARARSKAFAARLLREAGSDTLRRLDLAFHLACSRPLRAEEQALCQTFLEKQSTVYAEQKNADLIAWADLCQMLLASNAFLYIE